MSQGIQGLLRPPCGHPTIDIGHPTIDIGNPTIDIGINGFSKRINDFSKRINDFGGARTAKLSIFDGRVVKNRGTPVIQIWRYRRQRRQIK